MSACDPAIGVFTVTVDTYDETWRYRTLSGWFDTSDLDVTAIRNFIHILRLINNTEVQLAVRATNDQNVPGNYSRVGSVVNSTTELLESITIASVTSNKLFVQFGIAYRTSVSGTDGQAEVVVFPKG